MAIEPIESLMNKIMNRYDDRAIGWSVLTDYKGNMLVLCSNEGYMLKTTSINPTKHVGVGMKINDPHEIRRLMEDDPTWGFRPLSTKQTKELLTKNLHD